MLLHNIRNYFKQTDFLTNSLQVAQGNLTINNFDTCIAWENLKFPT